MKREEDVRTGLVVTGFEPLDWIMEWEPRCFPKSPFSRKTYEWLVRQHWLLLYREGGRRVGWAGLIHAGDQADLATIAVIPPLWGRGIGKRMLREVLLFARIMELKEIFLEVRPSLARARRLYEYFGFELVTVRRKYYPDGEDALVMGVRLSGFSPFIPGVRHLYEEKDEPEGGEKGQPEPGE